MHHQTEFIYWRWMLGRAKTKKEYKRIENILVNISTAYTDICTNRLIKSISNS